VSAIKKSQITNTKQITMTEIQNTKQLPFDLPPTDLDIVIWNLFDPILRSGGACNLLFPVYPGSTIAVQVLALTTAPQGPLFLSAVSEKS